MINRKTPKASLENKRFIFFEIGFIITLLIIILAFEWSTKVKNINDIFIKIEDLPEDEFNPVPISEKEKVIPKIYTANINIVSSNLNFDIEKEFADVSTSINSDIDLNYYGKFIKMKVDSEETDARVKYMLPSFMGKTPDYFASWIASKVNYPEEALQNNYEFKVFIEFVVNEKGKIEDLKIKSPYSKFDDEIKNIVFSSPDWAPGIKNGKVSKFKFSFPIVFKISYN